MSKVSVLPVIAITSVVLGCATTTAPSTYFNKPGVSLADYQTDEAECMRLAIEERPVTESERTAAALGGLVGAAIQGRKEARAYYTSCMESRGYVERPLSEEFIASLEELSEEERQERIFEIISQDVEVSGPVEFSQGGDQQISDRPSSE